MNHMIFSLQYLSPRAAKRGHRADGSVGLDDLLVFFSLGRQGLVGVGCWDAGSSAALDTLFIVSSVQTMGAKVQGAWCFHDGFRSS